MVRSRVLATELGRRLDLAAFVPFVEAGDQHPVGIGLRSRSSTRLRRACHRTAGPPGRGADLRVVVARDDGDRADLVRRVRQLDPRGIRVTRPRAKLVEGQLRDRACGVVGVDPIEDSGGAVAELIADGCDASLVARLDSLDRLVPGGQPHLIDGPAIDEHDRMAVGLQVGRMVAILFERLDDVTCRGLRRLRLGHPLVVDARLQIVLGARVEDFGHGAVGVIAMAPPAYDERIDVGGGRLTAMQVDDLDVVGVVAPSAG